MPHRGLYGSDTDSSIFDTGLRGGALRRAFHFALHRWEGQLVVGPVLRADKSPLYQHRKNTDLQIIEHRGALLCYGISPDTLLHELTTRDFDLLVAKRKAEGEKPATIKHEIGLLRATITLDTLRHTFASKLVKAGVSLYEVSVLLGHSDPKMTQRYAHLSPNGASRKVVKVIDSLLQPA
jgi:hypothetical protein